jgi:hypothetical protein
MKSKFVIALITFSLSISINIYAQESDLGNQKDLTKKYIIQINEKGALEKHYRVKYGSVVNLKISGINPRKLKVESKFVPYNFEYSLPKNVAGFLKDKDSISSNESSNSQNGEIVKIRDFIENGRTEMTKKLEQYKLEIDSMKLNTKTKTMQNRVFDFGQKLNALTGELSKTEVLLEELNLKIGELEKIAAQIKSFDTQTSNFIQAYDTCIKYVSKIHQYLLLYKGIDSVANTSFIPSITSFKNSTRNFMISVTNSSDSNGKSFVNSFNGYLSTFLKEYTKVSNAYQHIAKEIEVFPTSISMQLSVTTTGQVVKIDSIKMPIKNLKVYKEMFDNLKAIHDKLSESSNLSAMHKTIIEAAVLYEDLLLLDNSFEIGLTDRDGKAIANPLTDDMITVAPVIKNFKGEVVQQVPSFNIHSYGKWKINVSSGYMLSFVKEDQFTNFNDTSGRNIGLVKANPNIAVHNAGFLIHAYKTAKSDVTYGYSAGISLPIANQPLSFFLGLSLLSAEKDKRLVLSAGLSVVQVQKLNKTNVIEVEKDKRYDYINSVSLANRLPTYDRPYQLTGFVSITYNLSNLK